MADLVALRNIIRYAQTEASEQQFAFTAYLLNLAACSLADPAAGSKASESATNLLNGHAMARKRRLNTAVHKKEKLQ